MPIKEVCSPINSSSRSRLSPGSNPPMSPGARSMPGRGRADQDPALQPQKARVSLGNAGEPAEVTVNGPQEHRGEHPQERQSPEE
jgi:hypothetical protein